MKHSDTPIELTNEMLTEIKETERLLIEQKMGSDNYLYLQMMRKTDKFNSITKPLEKYPNFNKNQNLY